MIVYLNFIHILDFPSQLVQAMSALLDQCVECEISLDCHIVNTLVPLIMEDVLRAQHVYSYKLYVLLINAVHPALPVNVSLSYENHSL